MTSIDLEKVRVLVVGDSGVGKSSFVHLLAHGQAMSRPSYTIGASVEVKYHEYKEGTPNQKAHFVELWDIGGSINHSNSRHIFFNPVHGIILVHDLTNRKSHANLRKWLAEVLNRDGGHNSRRISNNDYDPEQFAGSHTPILVIGTKQDQLDGRRQSTLQTSAIAEECGADEINLDCRCERHLAAGSTNAVKISRFFDKVIHRRLFYTSGRNSPRTASPRRFPAGKVIERRFHPRETTQASSPTQERRRISQFMKTSHTD